MCKKYENILSYMPNVKEFYYLCTRIQSKLLYFLTKTLI